MKDKFYKLTPILHTWVENIVKHPTSLFTYIAQFGSPVNIHHLRPFEENIRAYERILDKYSIPHTIFFARKANKCLEIPIRAAALGQGVDTASQRELQQCIEAGIDSRKLILTAAVKNSALFKLAAQHNIAVVLDNDDELQLAQNTAQSAGTMLEINIRLSGFHCDGKKMHTRFGFNIDSVPNLLRNLSSSHPNLYYTGLHFHLNGYDIAERVAAIEQSVQLIDELAAQHITTKSLDIGGGILMNYLYSEEEWLDFHTALREAITEKIPELTYQNDPLGIVKINGELFGEPTIYPYFNKIHKETLLEEILTSVSSIYRVPVHQLFTDRQLELRMEPGRSLLDQVGCTVAKVAFRKRDTEGRLLVGLEMNRTQLRSSSADFLLDPIHLPINGRTNTDERVFGYLVGSYCLEQELILKRKIQFNSYPEIGDLILFPNSAGYMMHFYESEAHLFELAKNIFIPH
ncbi:MAG TPA: alanine racemase [Sphingobacterium sp.]|nr:alanine racemase [Sphingobacterium sp.]